MSTVDRSQFVGASEIACLLYQHPFKTPLDLYNEKINPESEKEPSEVMQFGNVMEPVLIDWFSKWFLNAETTNRHQYHIRLGHAGATLDCVVMNGSYKRRKFTQAPLDIKVIGYNGPAPYHDNFGQGGTEEVPLHIYYQLQLQLHMCNTILWPQDPCRDGFVGIMGLQGQGLKLYRIEYQAHIGQMLVNLAESFWSNCIETKTPPTEFQDFLGVNF